MRTLGEALTDDGPLTRSRIREMCGLTDYQMAALDDREVGVTAIGLNNDQQVSHAELLEMARDAADRLGGDLVESGYRWESMPPDSGLYYFAVSRPA